MALFGKSRSDDAALAARYKRLLTVAKTLASERDLKKVLIHTMDAIIELSGAERGFVWLGPPDPKLGEVSVARNLDREHVQNAKEKLSTTIIKTAMESRETFVTPNAEEDLESRSIRDMKLRSVLCAPLILHDEVLGAIYVDHRFLEGEFSAEDRALLDEFRDLAAVAIGNAKLFKENDTQRKRLQELNTRLEREVAEQNEEMQTYRRKLRALKPRNKFKFPYSDIIGDSSAIREVFSIMDRIIPTTFPVLIEGESGTGKELVAAAIHKYGPRKNKAFLSENCAAVTESLFESELFGHVRGAFTGADRTRDGLFQQAHGGTLFLDEIGELSMAMQTKMLRALQEGEVRKVGASKVDKVDVRIVAASNRDLRKAVEDKTFREDLFYRLNVVAIRLPPLRERREDIETLLMHFLSSACEEGGTEPCELSAAAIKIMTSYNWPGNIRELQNEVKRLVALADGVVGPELLEHLRTSARLPSQAARGSFAGQTLKELERQAIIETLKLTGANKAETAKRLGISRRALYDKIAKYEIK